MRRGARTPVVHGTAPHRNKRQRRLAPLDRADDGGHARRQASGEQADHDDHHQQRQRQPRRVRRHGPGIGGVDESREERRDADDGGDGSHCRDHHRRDALSRSENRDTARPLIELCFLHLAGHLGGNDEDLLAQIDSVAKLFDRGLPRAHLRGGDVAGMQQPPRQRGAPRAGGGNAEQLVERALSEQIEVGGEKMVLLREGSAVEPFPLPLSAQPLDAALEEARGGVSTPAATDHAIVRDHQCDEADDRDCDPGAEVNDGDDDGCDEERDAGERQNALARPKRRGFRAMLRQTLVVNCARIRHSWRVYRRYAA